MVPRPAICAARQRRSPAMISYRGVPGAALGNGRTTMGWITPWLRIEIASSSSASWRRSLRGWYLPRTSASTGMCASSSLRGPLGTDAGCAGACCGGAGGGRDRYARGRCRRTRPGRAQQVGKATAQRRLLVAHAGAPATDSAAEGRTIQRLFLAADHLAGQREIGQRTTRILVMQQHRLAEGRRLGQPHIARNHRAEHHVAEVLQQLRADFIERLERGSNIVRRIPSMCRPGFTASRTWSMVDESAESPSSA